MTPPAAPSAPPPRGRRQRTGEAGSAAPAGIGLRRTVARCAAGSWLLALAGGLAGCSPMTPEVSGTADRPQLSDAQAWAFGRTQVLASWDPLADAAFVEGRAPVFHYRVDPARADGRRVFATVQAAVNRAHAEAAAGRAAAPRLVIGIAPGRYEELVYLPAGPVPISLWGEGTDASAVRIEATLDAGLPAAEYAQRHGPVFEAPALHADIAAMYRSCLRAPTLGTGCSAVLWTQRAGTQLRGLTLANGYDQRRGGAPRQPTGQHQALALKAENADQLQLEQVQLLGHQDTLYLAGGLPAPRAFVHRSLVAGDIDFIFGPATAYFLRSEIRWVGALRGMKAGYVAAPNTALATPHGFVFEDCDFTAQPPAPAGGVYLARQWFSGARCSPYSRRGDVCTLADKDSGHGPTTLSRATLEGVGKMAVLRSRLGAHLQRETPWSPWQADRMARNHRPVQRDSEDFWRHLQAAGVDPATWGYRRIAPPQVFLAEYRNSGPGALAPPAEFAGFQAESPF